MGGRPAMTFSDRPRPKRAAKTSPAVRRKRPSMSRSHPSSGPSGTIVNPQRTTNKPRIRFNFSLRRGTPSNLEAPYSPANELSINSPFWALNNQAKLTNLDDLAPRRRPANNHELANGNAKMARQQPQRRRIRLTIFGNGRHTNNKTAVSFRYGIFF